MTDVVSVGDLVTSAAMARRADWMRRFDVNDPPPPHPTPVLSAQPFDPKSHPAPDAALALAALAERNGWAVLVTYARGTAIDNRGRPGRLVDSLAVRMWRFPDQRAVAVYENGEAAGGWLWRTGELPKNFGVSVLKLVLNGADIKTATAPKSAAIKGACQVCAQLIALNKDGTVRAHGPKTDRCHGGRRVPVATTNANERVDR